MENTDRQEYEQAGFTFASAFDYKHIANMGKGQHVSLATIVKICETLQCDLTDVIALANTMYLDTSYLHLGTSHIVMSSFSDILISR